MANRKRNRQLVRAVLSDLYRDSPPGVASDYFRSFDDLKADDEDSRTIVAARVSTRQQHRRRNLDNQVALLQQKLRHIGHEPLGPIVWTGSGWVTETGEWIDSLVEFAVENHATKVIAESSCRWIRHWNYHSTKRPGVLPTVAEYDRLFESISSLSLYTYLDPDLPWHRVRAHQTRRGMQAKDKKGGRPRAWKTGYNGREEEYMDLAKSLYTDLKLFRETARYLYQIAVVEDFEYRPPNRDTLKRWWKRGWLRRNQ